MGYLSLSERQALEVVERYKQLPEETRVELEITNPRGKISQRQDVSVGSSLPDIIKQAKEFSESWKESFDSVSIDYDTEDDYGSKWTRIFLCIDALETDSQYYERLLELNEWNASRDAHDRKEFERLKQKFK